MPRATGAAAALKEELGLTAELIRGRGGIYVVRVGDRVVCRKDLSGFPTEDEVVEAVRTAMSEEQD